MAGWCKRHLPTWHYSVFFRGILWFWLKSPLKGSYYSGLRLCKSSTSHCAWYKNLNLKCQSHISLVSFTKEALEIKFRNENCQRRIFCSKIGWSKKKRPRIQANRDHALSSGRAKRRWNQQENFASFKIISGKGPTDKHTSNQVSPVQLQRNCQTKHLLKVKQYLRKKKIEYALTCVFNRSLFHFIGILWVFKW